MEARVHLKYKPGCDGVEHSVITTYIELLELGTSTHFSSWVSRDSSVG
jgi:hypothetical protein